jgi:hypothetical protein
VWYLRARIIHNSYCRKKLQVQDSFTRARRGYTGHPAFILGVCLGVCVCAKLAGAMQSFRETPLGPRPPNGDAKSPKCEYFSEKRPLSANSSGGRSGVARWENAGRSRFFGTPPIASLGGTGSWHRSATRCNELQRYATNCNDLQRLATLCNELQRVAMTCNEMQRRAMIAGGYVQKRATMQRISLKRVSRALLGYGCFLVPFRIVITNAARTATSYQVRSCRAISPRKNLTPNGTACMASMCGQPS